MHFVGGDVLGLGGSAHLKLGSTPSLSCHCANVPNSIDDSNRSLNFRKSEDAFRLAKEWMPGGVNSPVRAFTSVGGHPIMIDSAKGSHIWDIDGNGYIDYVGSWGSAVLGHADNGVIEAMSSTMKKGTSFGAPCLLENTLAEMVSLAVPSIEMVRFVNSGTEACMSALRLARAFTGRKKIVKFDGCYHGHSDSLLVKAGSGVATLGIPDSLGVPPSLTADTLTLPFNDSDSLEDLFEEHKGEIAAVIVEPIVGNSGFIPPKQGFLSSLERTTGENGALLIFDEVMTGFRVSYGGAQERFSITPDLTTLGKIIGGGLPVGAFGGRREIMEMVAPSGPVYQAGTLSGNPLAMAAGVETMKRLQKGVVYGHLRSVTEELVREMIKAGKSAGHGICGGSDGGMLGFFFCDGPVHDFEDAKKSDTDKFARFHRGMLEEGVYLPPSPFEAWFTSVTHTLEDVEETIKAAAKVFDRI